MAAVKGKTKNPPKGDIVVSKKDAIIEEKSIIPEVENKTLPGDDEIKIPEPVPEIDNIREEDEEEVVLPTNLPNKLPVVESASAEKHLSEMVIREIMVQKGVSREAAIDILKA